MEGNSGQPFERNRFPLKILEKIQVDKVYLYRVYLDLGSNSIVPQYICILICIYSNRVNR